MFINGALRVFVLAACFAVLPDSHAAESAGTKPAPSASEATYVGDAACSSCHSQDNKHFAGTVHAKVFGADPKYAANKQQCESCHGPGSKHAANGSVKGLIVGFSKAWGSPVAEQNKQCLSCHQWGNRRHWADSMHQTQQIGCADCHRLKAKISPSASLIRPSINETCITCHTKERAEFQKRSHMPVLEGKMSCVDCHNPHGSPTKPMLKADSVNALCYTCHAEKRGPFIWEHAPVRESCLNCHQAHGSNHERLLNVARPMLCQQCHNGASQFSHSGTFYSNANSASSARTTNRAAPHLIGRSCQTCHSQIHGSNHPAGATFQR